MRLIRRAGIIVALALLVGAAINVGVALWVGRHSVSNSVAWSGGYIGEWPVGARDGWPESAILAVRIEGLVTETAAWPTYAGWDPSVLPEIQPWQRVFESGWPWPAVRAQVVIPMPGPGEVAPAEMPRADAGRSYRPVWPGFAHGTLFFGSIGIVSGFVLWISVAVVGPLLWLLVRPSRRELVIGKWRGVCAEEIDPRVRAKVMAARLRLSDAIAIAWWLSPRREGSKWVTLLGLSLLGGVVLTAGVSWGCALWPRGFVFQGFGKPMVIEQWGATFTSERVPSPSAAGYNEAAQVHTGWPWRTMRWTAENAVWARWAGIAGPPQNPKGIVREGIELPQFLASPKLAERRVPLDPIAAGWVKSVPVYSALAFVALIGLLYLRRGVRVRRGCCPACAYPVGPRDVCTECGVPLRGNQQMANGQMKE